jgi:hypothetical protein
MDKGKFHALSLLTPYDIDVPKIRIGPKHDGAYILADCFIPEEQPVMSYGISDQFDFDREMAERGHDVFMFDHTIDGLRDPHSRMKWIKEGVAHRYDATIPGFVTGESVPEENLYSIEDHLSRLDIKGNRIILKMDVEGYEFGAFSNISEASLRRFEQITMEVHGLHSMDSSIIYRTAFINVFEKINRHFTLFHVHANNVDGPGSYLYVDGMPVSNLIELSYIRSDVVHSRPNQTVYPTELDYPGQSNIRDKLMWIYPFLPASPDREAFRKSWEHVNATDPANAAIKAAE